MRKGRKGKKGEEQGPVWVVQLVGVLLNMGDRWRDDEHDGSQRQQQGVQAYPALSIDQFRTALITGAPPATRTSNVSEKCTSPGYM